MMIEHQARTLLFTALVLIWSTHSTSAVVLPYEPIQYLSAHLPTSSSSPLGDFLREANAQDAGSWLSTVKSNLEAYLTSSTTSMVLLKGEQVLLQHRVKGLDMNTSFEVPPANLLSIISIALPILFEGYDSEVVHNPISKTIKESASTEAFLDLVTKLPGSLGKTDTLSALAKNGKILLEFISTLLGSNGREAWMDAYMAMGVASSAPVGSKPMSMSLEDLIQFSLTVSHDCVAMGQADNSKEFPLDDDKYLFGWWFNCPKDTPSNCLIPHAPTDTIFSLSPDLRLYVTPSLELTLIIMGPGAIGDKSSKSVGSVADILSEDAEIWKELDPSTVAGTSKRSL